MVELRWAVPEGTSTQCPRCKNPHHKCDNGTPGVAAPVRFFRWELAQTHTGTIFRVKDERGEWVADFAEKTQAERFCRTDGVMAVPGTDEDQRAAVKFYMDNPRAALFDLARRRRRNADVGGTGGR